MIVMDILYGIILLVVAGIIVTTLMQNTKSEGLGAAITGASDTYRGAVGVEEQKRRLLQQLIIAFVALSFVSVLLTSWLGL